MAPKGPILPRKGTAQERFDDVCRSVAFQAGVLVAVERNRKGLTQQQLGAHAKAQQSDVTAVENGKPAKRLSDKQVDSLFTKLSLGRGSAAANFIKWWRDNG